MKVNGKYKFSLQFPDNSNENHQVGELLERLGNKKSAFIVPILSAYIKEHPELLTPEIRINIQFESSVQRNELKQMIYDMIEERLQSIKENPNTISNELPINIDESDIEEMLDNLDLF